MEYKFKVGDKVVATTTCGGTEIGKIYEVKECTPGGEHSDCLWIWGDNGKACSCNYSWEKVVNKQNYMQKLNSMLKRLLDKDSQALYKAGFIDGDLKLTLRGQEELNGIVFEANKAELVRLAQEQIVEDKEDK